MSFLWLVLWCHYYESAVVVFLLYYEMFISGHSCSPSPQTNIPKFFIKNCALSFCGTIFGLAFWPYLRQIAAVFGRYVKNPLLMFLFLIPLFWDRHIPDLVGGARGGDVSETSWSTFQPLKLFILLDEHVHFYIFICSSRYDSLHIFQFIKLLFENRWGFKRAGLITGILSHATNACACDF